MKRLIVALSIFTVAQTYANDGLVTVKDNGTYTVGSSKSSSPIQKIQLQSKVFPTPSSGFRVVK